MASIKNMLPDDAIVVRDGAQQSITSIEIVPGDLLSIKMGDKLPADVRFVQVSSDAKFDRSILTGNMMKLINQRKILIQLCRRDCSLAWHSEFNRR